MGKSRNVVSVSVLLSALFLMQSPLNPLSSGVSGVDSSVFRYVGRTIAEGGMPYRDTFDHKGPLLYLYNWIATCINSSWGIWAIELVSLTAFMLIVRRIASEVCQQANGLAVQGLTLLALLKYFQGGNLVEEYSLPFIGYTLLVFVRFFKRGSCDDHELLLCGVCLGCVLLLRPNMVGLWVGFGFVALAWLVGSREYRNLGKSVAWLIVGALVVVGLAAGILAQSGVLGDCIECYLTFNMRYVAAYSNVGSLLGNVRAFVYDPLVLGTLGVALWLALSSANSMRQWFWWGLLASTAVSLGLVCTSGYSFNHYGMVLLPLFVPALAETNAKMCELPYRSARHICFIAVSVATISLGGLFAVKNFWVNALSSSRAEIPAELVQICDAVEQHTTATESIAVWGNYDMVYLITGHKSATRWSYTAPILDVDSSMNDEYFESLAQASPKVIVASSDVVPGRMDSGSAAARMASYLDEKEYKVVGNESDASTYRVWVLGDQ